MRLVLPLVLLALPATLVAQSATPPDGKRIFETLCVACHTMEPPARLAPPMRHIVSHYRDAFKADSAGAIAHIAAYILDPAAERSKLPAEAIEKFGVMPAQALTKPQAAAVARYVWHLEAMKH
jgi:cytochrome c